MHGFSYLVCFGQSCHIIGKTGNLINQRFTIYPNFTILSTKSGYASIIIYLFLTVFSNCFFPGNSPRFAEKDGKCRTAKIP